MKDCKELQTEETFEDDGRDPDEKSFSERRRRNKIEWLIDIDKRINKQKQRLS